jgi:hypothetical protein
MRMSVFLAAAAAVVSVSSPVLAGDLYVNGANVTAAGPQSLDIHPVQQVIVEPDGDVHVIAPEFILAAPDGTPLPADPVAHELMLNGRFYLITDPPAATPLPDRIEVVVNGQVVRVVSAGEPQVNVAVSEFFRLGENHVQFRATRQGSAAGAGPFRVLVGRGEPGEGVLRLMGTVACSRTVDSSATDLQEFIVTVSREAISTAPVPPPVAPAAGTVEPAAPASTSPSEATMPAGTAP